MTVFTPSPSSVLAPTLPVTSPASGTPKAEGEVSGKRSISDFLEASFASFDRRYGSTGTQATITAPDDTSAKSTASKGSKGNTDLENDADKQTKSNKEGNNNSSAPSSSDATEDEEEAYTTLTYLALLTSLYLPLLLFLYVRRSMVGAASLIRSLFLGHLLRLLLAFMILPPNTTKTFVPGWLWNFGIRVGKKAEILWNDQRFQKLIPGWTHLLLGVLLGVEDPTSHVTGSSHGASVLIGGEKNTWPPPALMGLAIFTIVAFVVHPDGLTWILIGRLRDAIQSLLQKTAQVIRMIRDGTLIITPAAASGSLATIVLFLTLVHRLCCSKHDSNGDNNQSIKSRGKLKNSKHKKGKKGRGGRHNHNNHNHHNNNSSNGNSSGGGRGRTRIRDTHHFRSSKESYESPPPRSPSKSKSPLARVRSGSDVESSSLSVASEPNLPSINRAGTGTESSHNNIQNNEQSNQNNNSGNKKAQDHSQRQRTRFRHDSGRKASGSVAHAEDDKSCSSLPTTVQKSLNAIPTALSTVKDSYPGSRKGRGKRGKKGGNQRSSSLAVSSQSHLPQKPVSPQVSTVISEPSSPRSLPAKLERTLPSLPATTDPRHDSHLKYNYSRKIKKKNQTVATMQEISPKPTYGQSNLKPRTKQDYQSYSSSSFFSSSKQNASSPSFPFKHLSSENYMKDQVRHNQFSNDCNRERAATAPESSLPSCQPQPLHSLSEISGINMSSYQTPLLPVASSTPSTGNSYNNNAQFSELLQSTSTQGRNICNEGIERESNLLLSSLDPVNDNSGNGINVESNTNNSRLTENSYYCATPNYTSSYSYLNRDLRYSPGKIELAAFLAQAGLVGTACSDLLANLMSVDELELLTDAQYETYSIGQRKREEIRAMLEARRTLLLEQKKLHLSDTWSNSAVVRPPPGLEPRKPDITNAIGGVQNQQQHLTFLASPSEYPRPISGYELSNDLLSSVDAKSLNLGTHQSQSIGKLQHPISNTHNGAHVMMPVHDEEEIEADMREVGEQMAVSLLDF